MTSRPWLGFALLLALGCSNEPQPSSAGRVEIPAQPPAPATSVVAIPAPPAPNPAPGAPPTEEPSAEKAEQSEEPWAKGLPPASGVVAPPKPVASTSRRSSCDPPYNIDPTTGHKRYKLECVNGPPPAMPTIKQAPIK
ncbi:MAG: hypothetical protein U0270_24225 [Labilithrix sp.]